MRITWRIVLLLMVNGVGVQRWLAALGLVGICIGAIVTPPGAKIGFGIYGLIFTLGCPAFVGGILLRAISVPRGIRLIPFGRAQLLFGMITASLTIAAFVVFVVWLLEMDPPPPTPLLPIFTLAFAVTSAVLVGMFVFSSSVLGVIAWLLIIGMTPYALGTLSQNQLLTTEVFTPARELLFGGAIWLAFGTWYLRTREISRSDDMGSFPASQVFRVTQSRETAILALLLGHPSIPGLMLSGVVGAVAMIGCAFLINALSPRSTGGTLANSIPAALTMLSVAGIGAFLIARRSKLLWLKLGYDRAQLFSVCERRAWVYFGAQCTVVPAVIALELWLAPERLNTILVGLLGFAAVGTATLYFGLMRVTRLTVVDVFVGITLVVAWLGSFAWVASLRTLPPILLPLAIAAIAAVCLLLRAAARQRWQKLDWLVCKPQLPRHRAVPEVSFTKLISN